VVVAVAVQLVATVVIGIAAPRTENARVRASVKRVKDVMILDLEGLCDYIDEVGTQEP
jgi:hypothetical protein